MEATGRKRTTAGILLVLLMFHSLLHLTASAEEPGLIITIAEKIRPYEMTELSLHVPDGGRLRLDAFINGESIALYPEMAVEAGILALPFEGLDAAGHPLPRGKAVLTAVWRHESQALTGEAAVSIMEPAAALSFAILADEVMTNTAGEELLVDYQLTRPGRMRVAVYSAQNPQQPLKNWSIDRGDTLPHRFRWDKRVSGQLLPAGEYLLTLEIDDSPQKALERRFSLTDEPFAAPPLAPTGKGAYLPDSLDEADVWAAVIAPVTVVDIGALQHQKIYSQPSEDSASLGVVHGQTAGLEVLEVDVGGFARVRAARHGDGEFVSGYVPQGKLKTILPDTRYGLLIDKSRQVLSVYERGKLKGELPVSTGIYVPPGESSFDSLAGAFLTEDRIAWFSSEGFRYHSAIRIDGGNLIHETGHRLIAGKPDFSEQHQALGAKASHGCVRVDNRLSDEGLNAWWLYANLPRNTKVLVLPERQEEVGDEPLIPHQADPLPEAGLSGPPGEVRIAMTFGGDCVLGSEEKSRELPESFHAAVEGNGYSWPFSGITNIFAGDDLSMVNLENVLKDDAGDRVIRQHNFRGPSAFAEILKIGGIELVNLANNHFPDYGQDGKNSTREALRDAGIAYAGYSSLYVFEKSGIRVGFAGIRETIWHQGHERIADEIAQLRKAGCHYIVYTCHFGNEYEPRHNALQEQIARAAVDAGADLVIGHHPHLVHGIEEYRGGLIFYSLGNLVFGGNLDLAVFDGLLVQVTLDFTNGNLESTHVRLLPVITSGNRPANDFRPVPAQGADLTRIMEAINQDSHTVFPESFVIRQRP